MVESNRSVRPLLEATLRSVTSEVMRSARVAPAHWAATGLRPRSVGVLCFGRTVGVEELAGQIDDGDAVPCHAHARAFGDLGHDGSLEIFLGGVALNFSTSSAATAHGHALLALGDGQLGAVQAVVLLGHGVQVDVQAVGQLADGDETPPAPKVVAALDQTAGVAAAEQALQLSLDRGVALLDLGTRGLEDSRCGSWRSRSRRRCRRGRCGRPAG